MNKKEISLHVFDRHENNELFNEYRKIKYKVFVKELGWNSLADKSCKGMSTIDPFDEKGTFIVAKTFSGRSVGIVRGIPLNKGFPHKTLFTPHFTNPLVYNMYGRIYTINALAVLPAYRGKQFRVTQSDLKGSIGKLLVLQLNRYYLQQGFKAVIATAEGAAGIYFFLSLGFRIIDYPKVTHLHSDPLSNVAAVFGSQACMHAEEESNLDPVEAYQLDNETKKLMAYFEKKHSNIIKSLPDYL